MTVRKRPTVVVHCKRDEYDVYIGRPSKWGNPYSHKRGSAPYMVRTREDAIEAYEAYIRQEPELLADLHELRGKRLGCWCAPQACHGDVLVKLIEEQEDKMIVAITGGRDVVPTEDELMAFLKWCDAREVTELRHGDCHEIRQPDGTMVTGVDKTVANAAWDHGLRAVVPYPAKWDEHGRAAGPLRNKEMLIGQADEGRVDVLVVWPGGRGTEDCKRRAHNLGIEVIEIETLKKDKDMAKKKTKKKASKKKTKKPSSSKAVTKTENAEVVSLPDLAFMDDSREKELEDDYEVLLDFEIENADDYAFASEQMKEDKKELKEWKAKEKSVTQDLSSALKKIRDLFRPRKKWLEKKEALWKQKMVEYDQRVHEQQRQAFMEASNASKSGDREAHQEALQKAAQAEVPSVDGVSTRYSWTFEVEDLNEVPRQFLVVDEGAVMAAIKEHNGEIEIPGLRIFRKATIAARV